MYKLRFPLAFASVIDPAEHSLLDSGLYSYASRMRNHPEEDRRIYVHSFEGNNWFHRMSDEFKFMKAQPFAVVLNDIQDKTSHRDIKSEIGQIRDIFPKSDIFLYSATELAHRPDVTSAGLEGIIIADRNQLMLPALAPNAISANDTIATAVEFSHKKNYLPALKKWRSQFLLHPSPEQISYLDGQTLNLKGILPENVDMVSFHNPVYTNERSHVGLLYQDGTVLPLCFSGYSLGNKIYSAQPGPYKICRSCIDAANGLMDHSALFFDSNHLDPLFSYHWLGYVGLQVNKEKWDEFRTGLIAVAPKLHKDIPNFDAKDFALNLYPAYAALNPCFELPYKQCVLL